MMKSLARLLPIAVLIPSSETGCSAALYNNQTTAIDCYAALPEEVERDAEFLASPTHSGSVETDSGILEQFQIAFKNDVGRVDGLQNKALENWVGIAYAASAANPTDPTESWNMDYVFNVAFSTAIPESFADYDLYTHFDEWSARTLFAYADTETTPSRYEELKLVITNQCHDLVSAANGDVVFPLTED